MKKITPFEELNIIDDYMANAAASDAKVGKQFARALVEGLLQIKLSENIRVNIQRTIVGDTPTKRGIRMDIEVLEYEEEGFIDIPLNVYNIEPNKSKSMDIIKHNRFYQAKIDSRNLKAGEKNFVNLPNLFVMMITNYDPFGYDYMLYTIHNKCEEVSDLKYNDGLSFLYFNTTGTLGGSSELKSLLTYIQESKSKNVTNESIKKLHEYLCQVKESPEARAEYMLWEEKIFYERSEAKEEGREEERLRVIKLKLDKGKNKVQIADELELEVEDVETYIQMLQNANV